MRIKKHIHLTDEDINLLREVIFLQTRIQNLSNKGEEYADEWDSLCSIQTTIIHRLLEHTQLKW